MKNNKQLTLVPPPKNTIVFAYGSNMNVDQMHVRCPTARPTCVARLVGHRIAFSGWNSRWSGAVATVVPDRRSSVDGVLWLMSHEDMVKRLDAYEGVPFVYDRAPVQVVTEKGDTVWCHTYVKNDGAERPGQPSEEYLKRILDGYRDAGLKAPKSLRKLYARLSYDKFLRDVDGRDLYAVA